MAWGPNDKPAILIGEKTLIVWNAQTQTQHFIRSARFSSQSELGFIVPLPSIPEVADLKDDPFALLDKVMEDLRPKNYQFWPRQNFLKGSNLDGAVGSSGGFGGAPGAVQVVATYDLEEFEVNVLKANELAPLEEWIQKNAFELRPALKDWLNVYLNEEAYFAVFKFKVMNESPESLESFTSKAVRLSFKTKVPFYPYRDAKDNQAGMQRNLNLYFLAEQSYEPDFFQNSALLAAESWQRNPMFSSEINVPSSLREFGAAKKMWLTLWQDDSLQRPDRDLNFVPRKAKQRILLSPEDIDLSPYVMLALFFCGLGFVGYVIFRILKQIFRKKSV